MGAQRQKQALVELPPTDHSSAHFLSFYPFMSCFFTFLSYFLAGRRFYVISLSKCSSLFPNLAFAFIWWHDFKVESLSMSQTALSTTKKNSQPTWPPIKEILLRLKLPHSTVFPFLLHQHKRGKKSFPRRNSFFSSKLLCTICFSLAITVAISTWRTARRLHHYCGAAELQQAGEPSVEDSH